MARQTLTVEQQDSSSPDLDQALFLQPAQGSGRNLATRANHLGDLALGHRPTGAAGADTSMGLDRHPMTAHVIALGPPVKMELRHCALEHSGVFPALGDWPLAPVKADEIGHRPVLEAVGALRPGEAVRIDVDHDPALLLDTIWTTEPDAFSWEPLALGPERWVGVIRRRRPGEDDGSVRPLPSLRRRAGQIAARTRLGLDLRELAMDLIAPVAPGELSPEAAAWLSSATAAAEEMVRDGALSVLVGSLDTLLAAAPPQVAAELRSIQERRELGVV